MTDTKNDAAPATPQKSRKIDQAVAIFTRHLPTRESLPKRAWRALVVADIKKELEVSNPGTLGMYFSWSDQLVGGRTAKQYNRTAPRATRAASAAKAPREGAEAGDASEAELNKLANAMSPVADKGAEEVSNDTAPLKKAASKKAPAKKTAKPTALIGSL